MRLTQAEKEYLGHFVQAHRNNEIKRDSFFMGEEELQAVAALHRRGWVTLENDYEGHNVILSDDAYRWLANHAQECHDLWLAMFRAKHPRPISETQSLHGQES